MLSPVDKIDGILAGITRADIEKLEPTLAKRLARALRRIADFADPPNGVQKQLKVERMQTD
jgi:hypothetical protein